MLSLRSKLLIGFFIVALLFGLTIPMLVPSILGFFTALFWFLVIMPAVSIQLIIRRRKKGRHGRRNNQRAVSLKGHGSSWQGDHNSLVAPQTSRNGEVVKSGGERMIADYLYQNNIRYEYERPMIDSRGRRISRPDFYLPDYNVYIEYWGMVNSDQTDRRQAYIKSMEWKKERYRENGIKFISIYPQDLGYLDGALKARLQSESQA
jgi:hypothetical protein